MTPIVISYDGKADPGNPGWLVMTPDGWQQLDGPGTETAPTDEHASLETMAPFARRAFSYHTGQAAPDDTPVEIEE